MGEFVTMMFPAAGQLISNEAPETQTARQARPKQPTPRQSRPNQPGPSDPLHFHGGRGS